MQAAIAPNNYTPQFPIAKDTPIAANERVRTIRDFQKLNQANLTQNTLRFYPRDPSQSKVRSNYQKNPLPRNFSKRIVSLGFYLTPSIITDTPPALVNALNHAGVVFKKAEGDRTTLREHFGKFAHFAPQPTEGAIKWPMRPLVRMADADKLIVGPDESFDLELEFDDPSGLPATDAGYDLGAFLQIVHPAVN